MANSSNYHPFDKLILFDADAPRTGWVTANHRCAQLDGHPMVHVATHAEDALAGCGRWLDARKVRPWTVELWTACEAWIRRREELQQDLITLAKGKTPARQGQLKLE